MGLVHSLGNTLLTFDLPYFVSQGQVCMLLQVISGLPTFAFQSPILKRQESLRRNGVAIMVNKRVRNAVLGCNLKNDRMISVLFQGMLDLLAVQETLKSLLQHHSSKASAFST